MKRENFYRRDPMKALSGMTGLSLEEKAVYNTIIDLLYATWRPLQDNRAFIAGWAGCAVQKLNPIIARLIAKGRIVRFEEGAQAYLTDDAFEQERLSVKGKKPSPTPQVEENSGEVGEKSEEVGENPPIVPDNDKTIQDVTALEKTREDKRRISSSDAREANWPERLAEATQLAGEGLDRTSPSTHVYAELRQLCEPEVGEPCLWSEVLDAVQIEATKAMAKRKPLRSWSWIRSTAINLRDRRLQGLPEVSTTLPRSTGPPLSYSQQADAVFAAAKARLLEDG